MARCRWSISPNTQSCASLAMSSMVVKSHMARELLLECLTRAHDSHQWQCC